MNTNTTPIDDATYRTLRTWRVRATFWIEVHRPDTLNAIDFEVMDELFAALDAIARDETIRAVVLTGSGTRCFISGGDLKAFAALTTEQEAELMARRMREVLLTLERLPCWTVACINGDAYGGGCETLVACDLRYAQRRARLGWTQTRFALPCGWGGMTRLVELVGRGLAIEWLATSKILTADEALVNHLIHEVFEPDTLAEDVQRRCDHLTRHPRHLILALKQAARNASNPHRDEAMERELQTFCQCWAHADHLQAVEDFLDRD